MNGYSTMLSSGRFCRRLGVLVLSLASCLAPVRFATAQAAAPAPKPEVVVADMIVAVVNTDVITLKELEDKMAATAAQLKLQNITPPPQNIFERQVLENMILERAQLQMAKEKGVRVDDTALDRTIQRIAEQNKMSVQQLRNQIEKEGTNFPRFREEIRDEITMQRLREAEVISKIQISDVEVDNFLFSNASGQQQAQQEYDVSHILIRIPDNASSEQIAQKKERADDVLKQLRAGADFAKLAASYSDATDALKGGSLGWRDRERLPQLFVDVVLALRQGEVSEVIRSPNGFHIVKLFGKRTAEAVKSDATPAITQTHARHIIIKTNQVTSYVDARRKLADIKAQIDSGAATFEEMAKRYSGDLTASKGGDLGWLYPGDTVPEFERAMDALPIGKVSDPVDSPFGVHLIQVIERKNEDVSKDRQRMAARQVLRERKSEEAIQDWLRQLRDSTYVEYRFEDK